jgi:hypothetical protein
VLLVVTFPLYLRRRRELANKELIELMVVVLLTLFILGSYVYRSIALSLYGQEYVAFTPSRFLTDMVYGLSLMGAIGFDSLRGSWRLTFPISVALLVLLGCTNFPTWKSQNQSALSENYWEAYQWIKKNTSEKTIIATMDKWAVYASWRPSLLTPMHIAAIPYGKNRKQDIVNEIISGERTEISKGWELLAVNECSKINVPHTLLWRHESGLCVVRLEAHSQLDSAQ